MRRGTARLGLVAAVLRLLAVLAPMLVFGGAAQAAVTCPSAELGEVLNITTTGGVTSCANIGTAKATSGIEILNSQQTDLLPTGFGATATRFGIALRRVTSGGNEQPTAAGCVGDCWNTSPGDTLLTDASAGSSSGFAADWQLGNGAVTLLECGTFFFGDAGCTISFQFSDGTSGSFVVASGSNTIPSFSLGGSLALPPAITGISPGYGPWTGGTAVTITGSNFDNATAVTFIGRV